MDVSDNLGDHSVKNTGLLNMNYKLNNFNKVGIRYIGSMTGKSVGRYREGAYRYESLGTNIQRRNLGYIQRNFHSVQLHGKHVTNNKMEISWLSSYTNMIQDEPDLRFFVNLYNISSTGEKSNYQVRPNEPPVRFYRDMSEINYDNKIDLSIPFANPFKGKFQFGGVYLLKYRDLALNTFRIRNTHTVDFSLYNNNLEGYLQQTYDPVTGEGIVYTLDHTDDLINSFKSEQEMYAGYGMIDLVLTNKLRVITGARIEYSDVLTENKSPISRKKKEGGYEATDILPSLNMTYELINDFNIRFAYSKTLARPMFNENSPINYYDYQKGMIINGNEELVRTKIDNIDLRFEYFFKPGELVAVSGFYKYFDNPIEIRFDTASNNPQVKFINTDEAFLYGLETEVRKKLDFVYLLRDFELGTNFTYVFSEVEIPEAEYQEIRQINSDAKNTRPLSGQAPYIFNAYLNYENSKLNFSSSLAFNITGDKIIILNKSITPDIYEEGRPALNFNLAKGIGNRLSFEFSVDNILDSEYHAYYNFDNPATYYQHTRGRTYSISFKYLID
jgi:TonB-dependent receptor